MGTIWRSNECLAQSCTTVNSTKDINSNNGKEADKVFNSPLTFHSTPINKLMAFASHSRSKKVLRALHNAILDEENSKNKKIQNSKRSLKPRRVYVPQATCSLVIPIAAIQPALESKIQSLSTAPSIEVNQVYRKKTPESSPRQKVVYQYSAARLNKKKKDDQSIEFISLSDYTKSPTEHLLKDKKHDQLISKAFFESKSPYRLEIKTDKKTISLKQGSRLSLNPSTSFGKCFLNSLPPKKDFLVDNCKQVVCSHRLLESYSMRTHLWAVGSTEGFHRTNTIRTANTIKQLSDINADIPVSLVKKIWKKENKMIYKPPAPYTHSDMHHTIQNAKGVESYTFASPSYHTHTKDSYVLHNNQASFILLAKRIKYSSLQKKFLCYLSNRFGGKKSLSWHYRIPPKKLQQVAKMIIRRIKYLFEAVTRRWRIAVGEVSDQEKEQNTLTNLFAFVFFHLRSLDTSLHYKQTRNDKVERHQSILDKLCYSLCSQLSQLLPKDLKTSNFPFHLAEKIVYSEDFKQFDFLLPMHKNRECNVSLQVQDDQSTSCDEESELPWRPVKESKAVLQMHKAIDVPKLKKLESLLEKMILLCLRCEISSDHYMSGIGNLCNQLSEIFKTISYEVLMKHFFKTFLNVPKVFSIEGRNLKDKSDRNNTEGPSNRHDNSQINDDEENNRKVTQHDGAAKNFIEKFIFGNFNPSQLHLPTYGVAVSVPVGEKRLPHSIVPRTFRYGSQSPFALVFKEFYAKKKPTLDKRENMLLCRKPSRCYSHLPLEKQLPYSLKNVSPVLSNNCHPILTPQPCAFDFSESERKSDSGIPSRRLVFRDTISEQDNSAFSPTSPLSPKRESLSVYLHSRRDSRKVKEKASAQDTNSVSVRERARKQQMSRKETIMRFAAIPENETHDNVADGPWPSPEMCSSDTCDYAKTFYESRDTMNNTGSLSQEILIGISKLFSSIANPLSNENLHCEGQEKTVRGREDFFTRNIVSMNKQLDEGVSSLYSKSHSRGSKVFVTAAIAHRHRLSFPSPSPANLNISIDRASRAVIVDVHNEKRLLDAALDNNERSEVVNHKKRLQAIQKNKAERDRITERNKRLLRLAINRPTGRVTGDLPPNVEKSASRGNKRKNREREISSKSSSRVFESKAQIQQDDEKGICPPNGWIRSVGLNPQEKYVGLLKQFVRDQLYRGFDLDREYKTNRKVHIGKDSRPKTVYTAKEVSPQVADAIIAARNGGYATLSTQKSPWVQQMKPVITESIREREIVEGSGRHSRNSCPRKGNGYHFHPLVEDSVRHIARSGTYITPTNQEKILPSTHFAGTMEFEGIEEGICKKRSQRGGNRIVSNIEAALPSWRQRMT